MKEAYKILRPYGFEQIFIVGELPEGCTYIKPPEINWKPYFNMQTQCWEETASQEERKQLPEDDVNQIEKMQKENEELKKRLDQSDERVLQAESSVLELADLILSSMGGGV